MRAKLWKKKARKCAYMGPCSESMFSFQNLTRPSLPAVARTFPSGDKDKSFTSCINYIGQQPFVHEAYTLEDKYLPTGVNQV